MILIARLLILVTVFSLAGCMGGVDSEPTANAVTQELVTSVIDGDTIELASGERVRYLGIDTPETHHPDKPVECFGERATERNRELVEGRTVYLVPDGEDRDQYGRLLRYVYADNTFVNGQLVWEGFGVARSFGEQPRLYQTLVQLERSARENARGLWREC